MCICLLPQLFPLHSKVMCGSCPVNIYIHSVISNENSHNATNTTTTASHNLNDSSTHQNRVCHNRNQSELGQSNHYRHWFKLNFRRSEALPSHQHSGSHAHAQCHDGTRCGDPAPDVTVSDTTRERPRFKSNNPFNQFLRQPSSHQIPHHDHDAVQIRGSAPSSTAPHWAAPLNMSELSSLTRRYAPREWEKVLDDVMYQRIGVEPGLECDELLRLQTVPRLPTGTGIQVLPCPICRCGY